MVKLPIASRFACGNTYCYYIGGDCACARSDDSELCSTRFGKLGSMIPAPSSPRRRANKSSASHFIHLGHRFIRQCSQRSVPPVLHSERAQGDRCTRPSTPALRASAQRDMIRIANGGSRCMLINRQRLRPTRAQAIPRSASPSADRFVRCAGSSRGPITSTTMRRGGAVA